MLTEAVAAICALWFIVIFVVCSIGYFQLFRWYSSPPKPSVAASLRNAPHVTIIRPAKGLDPLLYECLEATFLQTYPKSKLTVRFTVPDHSDNALPVIECLLAKYADFDARVLVESEDPYLRSAEGKLKMGPNPKIRSMSRAYKEAKGDIIWIVDCNVWVNQGACGRMVDRLCGFGGKRKNKFVHQLPLVVDVTHPDAFMATRRFAGGRFEEAWFSAAHAKFYTAINTVLIAPCIVGKSNMFRRSHLDALTNGEGLDFFSHNICEDHLVGDLLWKRSIPESVLLKAAEEDRLVCPDPTVRRAWGNHAMCFGDLAVQPVKAMSVGEFFWRRVRWLRVRKFTVVLATLVEPGTESIMCSLMGAYAATKIQWIRDLLGLSPSWTSFWTVWALSVCIWMTIDRVLYCHLQSGKSIEIPGQTTNAVDAKKRRQMLPEFVRFSEIRPVSIWAAAWVGRELLAFPIWSWAVCGGVTINWRGKMFRVGLNMKVKEIDVSNDAKDRKD